MIDIDIAKVLSEIDTACAKLGPSVRALSRHSLVGGSHVLLQLAGDEHVEAFAAQLGVRAERCRHEESEWLAFSATLGAVQLRVMGPAYKLVREAA